MNGKSLRQCRLAVCTLCGVVHQRKSSKAEYCCDAHRQRAYRIRKQVRDQAAGHDQPELSPPRRRTKLTGDRQGK